MLSAIQITGLIPVSYMLRVEGAFLKTRLGVIPFAAVGKTGLVNLSCRRKPSESCCQYPQTPTEKQGFGFHTKNPPARNRRCFWIASPALMTAPYAKFNDGWLFGTQVEWYF